MSKRETTPTFGPMRGTPPTIEWRSVGELEVDPSYQRSPETGLIRHIAMEWDWRLCAPLTVSRRIDPAGFFVIDGQHRLQAAKMRGDIPHLPCIISTFGSIAEEAGCFVAVNSHRKRVTPLDTFRAQLASGDARAVEISEIIHSAGLSLAKHSNFTSWRPRQISAISGVRGSLVRFGPEVTRRALALVARAWPDEILQYSGRVLAGLYPLLANPPQPFNEERFLALLRSRKQSEWFAAMLRRQAKHGEMPESAMTYALRDAYAERLAA
jgi:hypothetical protein